MHLPLFCTLFGLLGIFSIASLVDTEGLLEED